MEYYYEPHVHTSEGSKCAGTSGAEFARFFKARGYAGIMVTDHFFNGNTTVPRELTWSRRVQAFCAGYEAAHREGAESGLDVWFGWEYACGWAHFLTYGLSKEWLLSNPDVLAWDLIKYCERVHSDGGIIVHAHPFREGVGVVQLIPGYVDAVEVANGGRSEQENRHALDFAISHGLVQTAGSDIHAISQKRLCGVVTCRRLTGPEDYLGGLQSGDVALCSIEGPHKQAKVFAGRVPLKEACETR